MWSDSFIRRSRAYLSSDRYLNRWVLLISLAATGHSAAQTCSTTITDNAPISRYQYLADQALGGDGAVVRDTRTGLEWQRCSLGQYWNGNDCGSTGDVLKMNWRHALGEAGNGWRLPNIKEISSLVRYRCANPAINSTVFPGTPNTHFWTGQPYIADRRHAWHIYFGNGQSGTGNRGTGRYAIRLVR